MPSQGPGRSEATAAQQAAAAPPVRGRILIVDDEPAIRAATTRVLKGQHEVVAVGSGAEAQALLAADRSFDVVISDLMMPGISGTELHAWMATQVPDLARRVVFLTGGATTEGASEYLASVGNRCVQKPFEVAFLRGLIAEVVASARAQPR